MTGAVRSHDGFTSPERGFGTYRLNGAHGVRVIGAALDCGYRLLDSAVNYENEGAVGRAVRESAVPREEIVVASKLPGRHHDYDAALAAVEESVYRTGLDCIDLYLIHWPNPGRDRYVEAWSALIEARRRGLVRAIGVCNFLPEHLDRLERETGVLPAVNQIEIHPYFPQTTALAAHAARGIITQAWSPLGRGTDLLGDPTVLRLAQETGSSPAQVVLAWHVARGAVPLPKAADPARQRENLQDGALHLTPGQVEQLTALGRPDGRTTNQDPAVWEEL